jgi:hypothetical protein
MGFGEVCHSIHWSFRGFSAHFAVMHLFMGVLDMRTLIEVALPTWPEDGGRSRRYPLAFEVYSPEALVLVIFETMAKTPRFCGNLKSMHQLLMIRHDL